jgi:NAD(P)-dependent dehydrogenase (short-subunit alcohol dehydrogenase family)
MLFVDLTDFDTVEKLCQQLVAENVTIDGIVSNAGAVPPKPSKTKHGLDEMFQVNFVAPFFLVHRLIENNLFNLNGERAPRIVFVSSESHRSGKSIDINDLGNFGNYNLAQAVGWYGHSKILLNTFGTELAEKLKPKIEVHIMCPGPVNTNIIRKAPFVARAFMRVIFTLFFRSASKAAEPIVYLVASPEINGLTCQYLHFLSKKRMDERVYEPNIRKDLWKTTEDLLQKIGFPVKPL